MHVGETLILIFYTYIPVFIVYLFIRSLCRHRVDTRSFGACSAGHCFPRSRVRIASQRALGAPTSAGGGRRRISQYLWRILQRSDRNTAGEEQRLSTPPRVEVDGVVFAGGVSLNISVVCGLTQDSGALNPKINQFVDYLYLISLLRASRLNSPRLGCIRLPVVVCVFGGVVVLSV